MLQPELKALTLRVGDKSSKVVIDGGLYAIPINRPHGPPTYGKIPVVCFKSKRKRIGGVRRGTGEIEDIQVKAIGKEFEVLLAQAQKSWEFGSRKTDQEAYLITVQGTVFRLITCHFSQEYLSSVSKRL